MQPLYQVVKSGRTITVEPVDSEQTEARQIIFSQRENQIGAYREGRDIRLPAHALTRDADNKWLEYFDPRELPLLPDQPRQHLCCDRRRRLRVRCAGGFAPRSATLDLAGTRRDRKSAWRFKRGWPASAKLASTASRAMVAAEKARLERERIEKEMEARILAEMLESQPTEEEQLAEDLANFSTEDREIYESLQDAA